MAEITPTPMHPNAEVRTGPKGTAKRDALRKIEIEIQKEWEEKKLFEQDAPEKGDTKPKYLSTIPYPYMNGRLHLGHGFTITKAEFAANYQRLKGKNALFPFGFHCTGMPIKACADKLKREMEIWGNPPQFPLPVVEEKPESETPEAAATTTARKADPLAFHSQKSKATAKNVATYQWNILKGMNLKDEEIPQFADAYAWLDYFPVHAINDLKLLGAAIDWRRTFITTDKNPYYDSFVRWQFHVLREKGKIQFGKRYTIWSPKDGQPCADHDRASGEGVVPQEYTLIKLKIVQLPEKMKDLSAYKVYLVPGTLRPETMYGQTNCWVLPDGKYGAFRINENEVFICTERAAHNMAFQGLSEKHGETNCLLRLTGHDLLGLELEAPLSKYGRVYTLPMLTILPNKGTGIVTSVPSDSPDDYICLEELKRKPAFRAKFDLKDEMVLPFVATPIINIPDLGDLSAQAACEKHKVKSPNDRTPLDLAKDECYLNGFTKGVMLVGEHQGKSVKDAKPLIRDHLIAAGLAVTYSEPADEVVSRSGDECVVCLTDQWFLVYGEEKWKSVTQTLLDNMRTYTKDTGKKFQAALDWINQWACSRTYGLGTKLPWDPQYLIESLSDSTIYMSYYTVAHLLQGGILDGSKVGPLGISAGDMDLEAWDYVLRGKEYKGKVDLEKLDKLKHEFEYWYPVDIRVSGKELIPNHLTFFLYNHSAIWEDRPDKWPQSVRANGHVLLNGAKMSKSTGNFLTLTDAIERFGADGTRFGLADSGDSLEDSNFTDQSADTGIVRLFTELEWVEEMLKSTTLREGPADTFMDKVFANQIAKAVKLTDGHYEQTNFREALRTGFWDLQSYRDAYRIGASNGMNKQLVLHFIEVQTILLSPITPHYCEHVWKLLGKTGSVRFAAWPVVDEADESLLSQWTYLEELIYNTRNRKEYYMKPKAKKGETPVAVAAPELLTIHVARGFPSWKRKTIDLVTSFYQKSEGGVVDDKELLKTLNTQADLKKDSKKVMPFAAELKKRYAASGLDGLKVELSFDEKKFLDEQKEYLKNKLPIANVNIEHTDDEKAGPGEPLTIFS
ncbi:leucyl-tRNA synthetase, cytoplasmic-like [Planoprotostelium fungivorum]|uniref:leucine--tRNA ligase n=1 Tax=Planoprotostelium fungivorum TaxID=1890364 RepID=A0A2P6NGE8_9EUKA|nr:leucyl-tRNA synthetase, cytoplasmic-like [Planoprotostelium fungivorum]